MREVLPRPLTAAESAVLDLLLDVDHPDAAVLREQARAAVVARSCDCGCPSVEIEVPAGAPRTTHVRGGVWVREGRAWWPDPPSQESGVWILLFVEDGCLSYLEIASIGNEPTCWPEPHEITVSGPPSRAPR